MIAQGSPEWVADRRRGIGGSEIAAILGKDPHRSEFELALEKRGLGGAREQSWPMTFGHYVQRMAADIYHEMTGHKVRNVRISHSDPRWPHVFVSPDLRVVGQRRLVEVKWTSRRMTEPPPHWDIQVQAQMRVVGVDAVDILKVSGYEEPVIWTREPEPWVDDLLDMAEAWYIKFVEGDELPPVDGSRGASRYLDSQVGPPDMVASDEQAELVTTLRQIRKALDVFELDDRKLVNALKESMFGAYGLRGDGWRITWKPTKERTTTDWKAVAAVYRDELMTLQRAVMGDATDAAAAYDAIEALATTTGEGSRPFRLTLDKEEDAA